MIWALCSWVVSGGLGGRVKTPHLGTETIANPVVFAAKVITSLAALALLIVAAPALWCETGYSAGPRQRDAAGSVC